MTVSAQAQFPDKDVLACALFKEAIRHQEDARILHDAQRYPAAIASAMKAAELGVKTIIVLDGALGWWDKTFMTHSPMTEIKLSAVFSTSYQHIGKLPPNSY